ncbi:unnamed protein product [Prunus armeniaca]
MLEARAIELFTIVGDDCVQKDESVDDAFPYEVLNFCGGDRSKSFSFDPLCKVVYCDDYEFELALPLRHRADEVQSPLYERPRTDHLGERFRWLVWN